jgi:sulfur transfer complex TusBCD TusB component (DsrH family)
VATLHIVRDLDARLCLEVLDPAAGDRLLLVQDGVLGQGPFPCPVAVCRDDLTARNAMSPFEAVSYDGIRDLMLAHERVVLW